MLPMGMYFYKFFFSTHCTSVFYSLSSSMLMFLQFICNSTCKHTTKNWIGVKENNGGQPKIAHILKLMLGADEFGQSSIFFGISLIINLKSFYKHQFHCFSSISSFFFYFLFLFPLFIYFLFEWKMFELIWIWRSNWSLEKALAS